MAGAPLELIAVEVRADLDQLQRQMPAAARVVDRSMDQVSRSVVQAERQVVVSSNRIGQSFNNAAQRSRLLGYQISDIGTQLASGTSPFLILAQQGPQVANALEGVGGAAGRLAAFFSGPWGAALLAATTIAGGLIAKLWETGDAADEAAASAQRLANALSNLGNLNFNGEDITTAQREMLMARGEIARLEREIANPARQFQRGTNLNRLEEARRREAAARQALEFATDPTNPARLMQQRNQAIFDARPERPRRGRASAAERAAREAQREAERLQREAEALEKRYSTTKDQLTLERQLSELRDRGTLEAQKQADLLESAHRIASQFPELAQSTNAADQDRLRVLQDIAAATIEEAYGRKQAREELERWFEEAEKRQREQQQARERAEREAQQTQEQRIRTLGQLYYDAFNGGTEAIWDNFKQIGLAVIAEVLARWTVAQLGGQAFNAGDALGAAIGSVLPGFASGGSMVLGGRGGTDRNVLSLNGRPLARVSAGEVLNVTNPALSRQTASPVVISSPKFDLRGAVVTEQLYADMERISRANAAQAAGRAYQQSMKDAPGAVQRSQRYGG